jgi:molybdate transport system substrate-binding protein
MSIGRAIERITGISSMAMRQVLADLVDTYERQSGQHVAMVSVGGVDALRRVRDGEAFDFVTLGANAIEELEAADLVDAATRVDLARSGIAIAIRTGAPRPDIGSESAVRDAVLRARAIGYSTGPSGAHVTGLFERWGITGGIEPRLVQAPPGVSVGTLVANGEIELGFQQLSELMHVPGVEVAGVLPPAIQGITLFSAGVCTASTHRAAAVALISFLASPEADATMRRHGMEPARSKS